jgi:hypothetical protein
LAKNEPPFLHLDEKDSFFWLIKKAKKVVYGWIIAARCDSFFWLIKEAKNVVYGWKHRTNVWHISRRLWKREDLDEIRPKMSLIFCFWMGKIPFLAD